MKNSYVLLLQINKIWAGLGMLNPINALYVLETSKDEFK